jgi:UDP-N-acetylmuramate dehydrogenase
VLSPHTSFHIGGPARFFVEARSPEALSGLLRAARALGVEPLVIGGGTNLLVSDRGFDGLAIRLALDSMTIDDDARTVTAQAGVRTSDLVSRTEGAGLGGLQFAAGLPGTVGGGLAGNAGCFGKCLGDNLLKATVIAPTGESFEVKAPSWFQFGYRRSRALREGYIIAEATFRLSPGDPEALAAESREHLDLRRKKHPAPGTYTAGSYFKNLPPRRPGERRRAAGWFLDQAGARELSVGDAAVFERHANIVINRGQATAEDVLVLAREMQRRVKDKFDLELEPEVRFVGVPQG